MPYFNPFLDLDRYLEQYKQFEPINVDELMELIKKERGRVDNPKEGNPFKKK